jgi:predicted thioesterase
MEFDIQAGMRMSLQKTVEIKDTAKAVASGLAEVFATPAMIALMENAAYMAVQAALPQGYSTVGAQIDAKHIAATPVGFNVTVNAVLTAVEGKKLTFFIEAFDEAEKIGEALHIRFIIDEQRFQQKADAKKAAKA